MDWQILLPGSAVVLVAAALRQMTGFGYAMVTVSMMSLMIGPREAVAVTLILQFMLGLRNIGIMARHTCWPIIPWMGLAGVIAAPVGLSFLHFVKGPALHLLIGAAILFALLPLLQKREAPTLGASRRGSVVSGFAAGFLNSVAAMPAPPLLLYLMRLRELDLERRRATLFTIFSVLTIASLGVRVTSGSIDRLVLVLSLALCIPTLVGDTVGRLLPWGRSRRIVDLSSIAIVIVSALILIVSAFTSA